jgi:hypothetical protein
MNHFVSDRDVEAFFQDQRFWKGQGYDWNESEKVWEKQHDAENIVKAEQCEQGSIKVSLFKRGVRQSKSGTIFCRNLPAYKTLCDHTETILRSYDQK